MNTTIMCPRCRQKLETATCQGVGVELCRKCNGLLIEQQRLVPLLGAMTTDLAETIDLATPLEKVPDPGGGLNCPRCQNPMHHHGYMESQWVMVDNCLGCGVLWAHADGLGVISLMFARSRKKADMIHKQRWVPVPAAAQIRANQLGTKILGLFG